MHLTTSLHQCSNCRLASDWFIGTNDEFAKNSIDAYTKSNSRQHLVLKYNSSFVNLRAFERQSEINVLQRCRQVQFIYRTLTSKYVCIPPRMYIWYMRGDGAICEKSMRYVTLCNLQNAIIMIECNHRLYSIKYSGINQAESFLNGLTN